MIYWLLMLGWFVFMTLTWVKLASGMRTRDDKTLRLANLFNIAALLSASLALLVSVYV